MFGSGRTRSVVDVAMGVMPVVDVRCGGCDVVHFHKHRTTQHVRAMIALAPNENERYDLKFAWPSSARIHGHILDFVD